MPQSEAVGWRRPPLVTDGRVKVRVSRAHVPCNPHGRLHARVGGLALPAHQRWRVQTDGRRAAQLAKAAACRMQRKGWQDAPRTSLARTATRCQPCSGSAGSSPCPRTGADNDCGPGRCVAVVMANARPRFCRGRSVRQRDIASQRAQQTFSCGCGPAADHGECIAPGVPSGWRGGRRRRTAAPVHRVGRAAEWS